MAQAYEVQNSTNISASFPGMFASVLVLLLLPA